jgi:hypothetical protein
MKAIVHFWESQTARTSPIDDEFDDIHVVLGQIAMAHCAIGFLRWTLNLPR